MSTYNPNAPTGIVPLDQDYKNLQLNFQQADTSFGIDHLKFSNTTPQNGYHTVVHMIPYSTFNQPSNPNNNPPKNQPIIAPPNVPLTGEIFTAQIDDGINQDEAFYYRSGGGRISQLTRNFVPTNTANGSTFLPGGLIMQWGSFNPNVSTTVTFPIPFTVAPYNIQLTISANDNGTYRANVSTGSITTTQFVFEGTVSSHSNPVYWIALGI